MPDNPPKDHFGGLARLERQARGQIATVAVAEAGPADNRSLGGGAMTTVIPRHEPEIIEAVATRQHYGDDEKVATTSLDHLIVRGVNITSRYQKADELDLMRALVLALPSPFCGMVESIWCDSKACCCYSVVLREWLSARAFSSAAEIIGSCLETTLRSMRPFGHNGIDISDAKQFDRSIYLNPNWGDGA
jgi:hypothetical protein